MFFVTSLAILLFLLFIQKFALGKDIACLYIIEL